MLVSSGLAPQEQVATGPLAVAVNGMQIRVFEEREGPFVPAAGSGTGTNTFASAGEDAGEIRR